MEKTEGLTEIATNQLVRRLSSSLAENIEHPPSAQFITGNSDRLQRLKSSYKRLFGFSFCCVQVGAVKINGVQIVPRSFYLFCITGGAEYDFSVAQFLHPVTTIYVLLVCGGLRIIIPRGVRVEMGGMLHICSASQLLPHTDNQPTLETPIVRIVGLVVCGGSTAESTIAVNPLLIVIEETPQQVQGKEQEKTEEKVKTQEKVQVEQEKVLAMV